jgi:hypothetical protein
MSVRAQLLLRAVACAAAMIVATGALTLGCEAANPYRSSDETGYPSDLVNRPDCSASETSAAESVARGAFLRYTVGCRRMFDYRPR